MQEASLVRGEMEIWAAAGLGQTRLFVRCKNQPVGLRKRIESITQADRTASAIWDMFCRRGVLIATHQSDPKRTSGQWSLERAEI